MHLIVQSLRYRYRAPMVQSECGLALCLSGRYDVGRWCTIKKRNKALVAVCLGMDTPLQHHPEATGSVTFGDTDTERLLRRDWNFPDADGTEDIHSIHPYPAKFIPEIPRSLITDLGLPRGTAVFDPFCGCGTTLVEAQALGHPSVGVDLNPIACLITRVKTAPCPPGLGKAAAQVVSQARNARATTVPTIPNLDHWFQDDVQQALAAIAQQIATILVEPVIRDCLRLALSGIIVRVSNQDSDTRYAAVKKVVDREKVFLAYDRACRRIIEQKSGLPFQLPEARVIQRDILEITPQSVGARVGLMVTSPPYPNAYEYWLYHKYRMWWLGYDPIQVREREIGARAHYFGKKNTPSIEDFRRQMRHVLLLTRELLVPRGHACVLIGRSRIHGKDVDNASLISDVGKELGYSAVARIKRTIAATRKSFNLSHARIKTEEVLVLGK
jgi:DNA modification methylase